MNDTNTPDGIITSSGTHERLKNGDVARFHHTDQPLSVIENMEYHSYYISDCVYTVYLSIDPVRNTVNGLNIYYTFLT